MPQSIRSSGVSAFVAAAVALSLAACGDNGTDPEPPPPPPPPPVTVSISPTQATVEAGGTAEFTATVTNTQNTAVTWTASGGSISGSGTSATFTAPSAAGSVTVTATSVADPTASASATVTVTAPAVSISISPTTASALRGETVTFTATVTGSSNADVDWTASCGTVDDSGVFTAPNAATDCTVIATSVADPAATATADIEVLPDWIITSTADAAEPCAPASCSLRGVLERIADGDDAADADGFAVIRIADELAGETLTLESELPLVEADVRILGPTGGLLTIDADASDTDPRRIFVFIDVDAELERLRLTGGVAGNGFSGGAMSFNGDGNLVLRDMELVNNTVLGGMGAGGGGLHVNGSGLVEIEGTLIAGNQAPQRTGGGVFLEGGVETRIVNSRIEDNTAVIGGGIIAFVFSRLEIEGGTIARNTVTNYGGGLSGHGAGSIVATDVLIEENVASSAGGGMVLQSTVEARFENVTLRGNSGSWGGGVSLHQQTELVMRGGEIVGNEANVSLGGGIVVFDGASIDLEGVDVIGNRAIEDAGGIFIDTGRGRFVDVLFEGNVGRWSGGMSIWEGAEAELRDVRFVGNSATNEAGGLSMMGSTVTLEAVDFIDNESGNVAGGFAVFRDAQVAASGITMTGNRAGTNGGGIVMTGTGASLEMEDFLVFDNEAGAGGGLGQGGGIWLAGGTANTVVLDRGHVSGNRAVSGGGGILSAAIVTIRNVTIDGNDGGATGGGLFSGTLAETTVENVTISGNMADRGAGVWVTGILDVNGLTLIGNEAREGGSGIYSADASTRSGEPTLTNALLSGNRTNGAEDNCRTDPNAAVIISAGHNLSDDGACASYFTASGDLNDTDAGVDAELGDHGGFAPTHALQAGSAAIDAGNPSTCLGTDQRGFGREGPCDIGAFEFDGVAPAGLRIVSPGPGRSSTPWRR